MGKNLRQQRRGKGSQRYRSPSHRFLGEVRYADIDKKEGVVVDIIDAPGRSIPLAVVKYQDGKELMIPSEGLSVGEKVGYNIEIKNGAILKIADIPEGTKIYNIEIQPKDGGKLCRASGVSATIITKGKDKTVIQLPTGILKTIPNECRATIGVVAGSGRPDKPFLKAGNKFFAWRAKGKYYPTVKGVSKNPLDHPFGGKTKPGKHKTVSRHMPPGKKVGSISPRRTGKK